MGNNSYNTDSVIILKQVIKRLNLNGNVYVDLQIIFQFISFPLPTMFLFWEVKEK